MKIFLTALFTLAINFTVVAQKQLNVELKKQLDTILQQDQGIREFLDSETSEAKKDTLARLFGYSKEELKQKVWTLMGKIDSINFKKIEPIIAKYGYPGKTLVGEPTNTAVFYVIQHRPDQIPKYYPLIEEAGKKGELPFTYVAMMLDRKLTGEGKEQIYGTQGAMITIINPKTGEKEPFWYIKPIKDPQNVNKRRKEAGFDLSVEDNAKRLGIVYKVYTLEEINKMMKP